MYITKLQRGYRNKLSQIKSLSHFEENKFFPHPIAFPYNIWIFPIEVNVYSHLFIQNKSKVTNYFINYGPEKMLPHLWMN